ncbi:MAG: FAD:protein FMN transferase, partial [Gammaproteobacteria bacterium]|nr:FAD:protein FMN transferase [Gammaproteobacteria bacterium]
MQISQEREIRPAPDTGCRKTSFFNSLLTGLNLLTVRPSAALPSLLPGPAAFCRWLSAALLASAIAGCAPDRSGKPYAFDGLTMGSTWTVKVAADPLPVGREEMQKGIAGILEDIDARMSTYRESSELSQLNRNPSTDWIPISEPLYSVLDIAMQVSGLSGGAFDVTVGPLVNLWGFGPDG